MPVMLQKARDTLHVDVHYAVEQVSLRGEVCQ